MAGSISEDIPPMSFGEMKDIAIVLRGSTHPNGEEVDAVCGRLEGSGHVGLRLAVLRSEVFKKSWPRFALPGRLRERWNISDANFREIALLADWTKKLEHELRRVTFESERNDNGSEAYGIAHEWYNQEVRALNPNHMETVKESGARLREACRTAQVADTDEDHGTEVLNHAAARFGRPDMRGRSADGHRAARSPPARAERVHTNEHVRGWHHEEERGKQFSGHGARLRHIHAREALSAPCHVGGSVDGRVGHLARCSHQLGQLEGSHSLGLMDG